MSPIEALAIGLAGLAAGTINTIVGSGSLITFPTLLAFGYAPVVANISNTLGLVPGSVSGVVGYRRELTGQRARAMPLVVAALLGGVTGAVLLLALPSSAFERIVPILILVACVLVAFQPRLTRAVAERRASSAEPSHHHVTGGPLLLVGVYLNGIYGGYFGAAQGVILIALLAILIDDDLQRLNGLKNLLTVVVNGIAAAVFVLYPIVVVAVLGPSAAPPHVDWGVSLVLGVGAIVGGQLGASVGRRLSPFVLRSAIVVVGTIVAIRLLIA
jgi:uncharacterized protein